MLIYFYCCPPGPPEAAGYEHGIVALAEGLLELGVPFAGNIDYWNQSFSADDFLIRRIDGLEPEECDVVVMSSVMFGYHGLNFLSETLLRKSRRCKLIFLDESDGLLTPSVRPPFCSWDLVLKCHYSEMFRQFSNLRPWQFGLTRRIIEACRESRLSVANEERRAICIKNFRVGLPVRDRGTALVTPIIQRRMLIDTAEDKPDSAEFLPLDHQFWRATGRRHYRSFYKRLSASLCCQCFGGGFFNPLLYRKGLRGKLQRLVSRLSMPPKHLYQFDSWRFWECLCAGAAAVQADLSVYGCVLPVMPVSGIHYVGVDFSNPERCFNLLGDLDLLQKIGLQGQEWAIRHYSPAAVSRRFLELVT
jgi:hypothetical protein